jgi:CRISPR-associated exonuclease Cas4
MIGKRIARGYIFYFGSARREEVALTEELRQHTEETIRLAFKLLAEGKLPPPLPGKRVKGKPLPTLHPKCRDCSLEPLCLPREVQVLEDTKAR